MEKNFEASKIESKWYSVWMKNDFFSSKPDHREPFTIVIPPPNVTGVLHMGHMLNNTIQDVLIRRARMMGYNACWVPGTDHASIATEAKVVNLLREKGITKADISREDFLKHAYEWKDKYGGIILEQLKRLGASCDWNRTRFTMEPKLNEAVIKSFVHLFNKGYIYKDWKIVNWDTKAQTTLSNEEVIRKEEKSNLYYVKYSIKDSDEFIIIATTRPETIMGDTAVCVHPEDERYKHLHGKTAIVPMIGREIPIICDTYIDKDFGTGCLKVTPAHDINDYEIGQKHQLETIDILNDDGTLNEKAQLFVGEDRFAARKLAAEKLKELGLLVKTEEIVNNVGYSERNPDTVVEPKLSLQWFVSMEEMVKPALENVLNDEISFHPASFKNVYKHWLENFRDWPISRQLWWGQQIPAYYYNENNDYVVAENAEQALELAKEKTGNNGFTLADLRQDEDVVDTWFSSWLWPISVFDGFNENSEDFNYYYPTNVLVTGWDIIFFWVARMIFAGYEFKQEKPFKHVYFTGMVRDKQRRKMSKSLGNSPDALKLIDDYGADGVRFGMLSCSAAGNDLLFDESLCEQGRNFSNKIWNALRLVNMWEQEEKIQPEYALAATQWFESRLAEVIAEVEQMFGTFRISEAQMTIYKLIWDDFCSWYLELVKPPYGEKMDALTYESTKNFFESLMKLLHPFMPFLTEEVWHQVRERDESDCIAVASWVASEKVDKETLAAFNHARELVTNIRNIRKDKNIPFKEKLEVLVNTSELNLTDLFEEVVIKLANIQPIQKTDEKVENAFSFLVGTVQYHVPFGEQIDLEEEIKKLEKELQHAEGFLKSVQSKLANEKFVQNAPEKVLEMERKKESDALSKISSLRDKLNMMVS
jgi:valyl-tRNA synthetase